MSLTFITWLWGDKYGADDIGKLAAGLRRHCRADFSFVVFSDKPLKKLTDIDVRPIDDLELIGRGCFCRLRMFDPEWQRRNGFDGRIVSLDLDLVITDSIDDLFHREQTFLILQGVNSSNPNPFNASVMMLRAGQHADVWRDFSLEKGNAVPFHEFPDDQGWIWHMLPNADGWKAGPESGIYGFRKPGWPTISKSNELPPNARIVAFIGWRKPKQFKHLPWMKEHWK